MNKNITLQEVFFKDYVSIKFLNTLHSFFTTDGGHFCHGTDEEVQTCRGFIEAFIPPAILTIFDFVSENSEEACSFVFDNVCDVTTPSPDFY